MLENIYHLYITCFWYEKTVLCCIDVVIRWLVSHISLPTSGKKEIVLLRHSGSYIFTFLVAVVCDEFEACCILVGVCGMRVWQGKYSGIATESLV